MSANWAHMEALKRVRKGQYSIRINDQFRICFNWKDGDAHNVEIVDYHQRVLKMASKKEKRLPPIHPGEVLQDLLKESGLSINALALALRVPANRIGGIVKGQRGVTADTALRLARYFGVSAQMWINLQAKYDLETTEDALGAKIEREVLPRHAA